LPVGSLGYFKESALAIDVDIRYIKELATYFYRVCHNLDCGMDEGGDLVGA
jgi:hypothetical protein